MDWKSNMSFLITIGNTTAYKAAICCLITRERTFTRTF